MHVVILGNGVTGVSAALRLRARLPECTITMISGESKYHYSRPALMYIFMGHMRYQDTKPFEDSFWDQHRIDLLRAWVTQVDFEHRRLTCHDDKVLEYDVLLLATGSNPNRFDWPGQDLDGVQGLWGLHDLHKLYETSKRTRHAIIVGGGLIGIELAEMLHSRGIGVTFLVREESYWDNIIPKEESRMLNDVIRDAGMELFLKTELAEIVDDGRGRCSGVVTNHGQRLDCQLVGLTAGVRPNVDLVVGTDIEVGHGILVDRFLATNIPHVYAAGDCAEIRTPDGERNLIQQVWYTGKMQGEHAADVIAGDRREYDPGIWFNSAKFLDLEYQTYGRVNMGIPGEQNIYWEHPDRRHSVRIVHKDGKVIGFNVMGLRWRHEVCHRWLDQETPIGHVLENLDELHFDPEFYRRYEAQIRVCLQEQIS